MAEFDKVAGIAGLITAVAVFGAAQLWKPPQFALNLVDAPAQRSPMPQEPRAKLSLHPVREGESVVDPAKLTAAMGTAGAGFAVEGTVLLAQDRRTLERVIRESGERADAIIAVGPVERDGAQKWRAYVLDKTVVVEPEDIVAAKLETAAQGKPDVVRVVLGPTGRERATAFGSTHEAASVGVVVDGVVLRVGRTAQLIEDGEIRIEEVKGFDDARKLAARLGGAPQPPPMWALQAVRLVPAIVAGAIVMMLFVIARRRPG